jgi:hypothetical protein
MRERLINGDKEFGDRECRHRIRETDLSNFSLLLVKK